MYAIRSYYEYPDRHVRGHDAGHRADRVVMVTGVEADPTGSGELLGFLGGLRQALEQQAAYDGAAHRAAHPVPGHRGAGVQDEVRLHARHDVLGDADADDGRLGGQYVV